MTSANAQSIPIPNAGFEADRPVGLFYRLVVNFTSGNRAELRTWLFLPGNRASRTMLVGSGDVFDPSRCNPDMCGKYQLSADKFSMRLDNGQVIDWRYKKTAEGIELDGDSYKPARPLTSAALVGRWAGALSTGDASSNVYTFNADGSFTYGTNSGRGVGGRYSLKGLTLTLDYSDGKQWKRTLFAAGTSEPVGLIGVDGEVYRRR